MSFLQKAPGTSSQCYAKAPLTMISCSSPARRSHERGTTKGHAWTRRQSSVLCERLSGRQASRTGPRSLHTGCATATDRKAPLTVVRDTLGHSNIAVTNEYAKARPDQSSSQYLPL